MIIIIYMKVNLPRRSDKDFAGGVKNSLNLSYALPRYINSVFCKRKTTLAYFKKDLSCSTKS